MGGEEERDLNRAPVFITLNRVSGEDEEEEGEEETREGAGQDDEEEARETEEEGKTAIVGP